MELNILDERKERLRNIVRERLETEVGGMELQEEIEEYLYKFKKHTKSEKIWILLIQWVSIYTLRLFLV